MYANILSSRWKVFSFELKNIKELHQETSVYIISIKKTNHSKRIIVYVGISNRLRKRLLSHDVLRLIRYNCTNYKIEILYKSFGYYWDNGKIERSLIKHYKPPFNATSIPKDYSRVAKFWSSIGVEKVIYLKKKYRKVKLKVA